MLYKILAVLTAIKYVMCGAGVSPPSWTTPTDGATFTLDASVNTACDKVTEILANSGDGTTVSFSVHSQTPAGGFATDFDQNTGNDILKCNLATIKASVATSYSVTLRATNSGVDADRNITITVTNLVATAASTASTASTAATNHPPVFNANSYTYTICKTNKGLENLENGVTLTSVTVTDADAGQTVTVAISGSYLTMDGLNVKVADKTAIKGMAEDTYSLGLTAIDNGTPAQTSTAVFTLTITSDEAKCSSPNHVSSLALLVAGLAILMVIAYMN